MLCLVESGAAPPIDSQHLGHQQPPPALPNPASRTMSEAEEFRGERWLLLQLVILCADTDELGSNLANECYFLCILSSQLGKWLWARLKSPLMPDYEVVLKGGDTFCILNLKAEPQVLRSSLTNLPVELAHLICNFVLHCSTTTYQRQSHIWIIPVIVPARNTHDASEDAVCT